MAQIRGDSSNDDGVVGTTSSTGKSGVFGFNAQAGGNGIAGRSEQGEITQLAHTRLPDRSAIVPSGSLNMGDVQ
jgi:hypothetical protein